MSPVAWPFLLAAGLVAGFVDAIAGGGGLITLPALLGVGLDPAQALATNKLQSTFGSGSAVRQYRRAGLVGAREAVPGIVATALGAAAGVAAVSRVDPEGLRRVLPFLLIAIALVMACRPRLGLEERSSRVRRLPFFLGTGIVLGFYDGFFGPGTGTLWTLALIVGPGFDFLRATAWTKWMNFTSNVVALGVFACVTRIDWAAGLIMGVGQAAGARLGAQVALRGGAQFIRPVFLTVAILVALKLLADAWIAA